MMPLTPIKVVIIVFRVVVTPSVSVSKPLKTFNAVITKTVFVNVPARAPIPID